MLGRGKVYEHEVVLVCPLVDAEASDGWFICLLLSVLSVNVSYDNLYVMF